MSEVLGYLGISLMLASLPLGMVRWAGYSQQAQVLAWLSTALLSLIPFLHYSLVFLLRGIFGEVSFATLSMLVFSSYQVLVTNKTPIRNTWVQLVILLLQCCLYASTMGYISSDLYSFGYRPNVMLLVVFCLLAWCWQFDRLQAIAWLTGIVAFASGTQPSPNLWDALIDPYIFLGNFSVLLMKFCQMLRTRE